jgi:hypothetical protein
MFEIQVKIKKIKFLQLLTILLCTTVTSIYAQSKDSSVNTIVKIGPVMTFEKDTHDFGIIEEGELASYIFKFSNTGDSPLV